jgi:hypothetical protein
VHDESHVIDFLVRKCYNVINFTQPKLAVTAATLNIDARTGHDCCFVVASVEATQLEKTIPAACGGPACCPRANMATVRKVVCDATGAGNCQAGHQTSAASHPPKSPGQPVLKE